MARLQEMTNVIPLLARSERLSDVQMHSAKRSVFDGMTEGGIKPFTFDDASHSFSEQAIYAVSSLPGQDEDLVDASLLMSSDYIPPLISSDLSRLLKQAFCQDGSARLRHAAASKCVRWRAKFIAWYRAKPRTVAPSGYSTNPLRSHLSQSALDEPVYPRLLANPSLYNSADNLRHSLERARPLQQQHLLRGSLLGDPNYGQEPGLEIILARKDQHNRTPSMEGCSRHRKHRRPRSSNTLSKQQDPLGLLAVAMEIRKTAVLVMEVVGGVGLLGLLSSLLVKGIKVHHIRESYLLCSPRDQPPLVAYLRW